jgi:outer membrane immunogenic protein
MFDFVIVAVKLQQSWESYVISPSFGGSGRPSWAFCSIPGMEMGMRKVLGLVGATLLFAGPALAADLNRPKPVYKAPPLVPVFSWTGWYIGGNAGYGWGENTDPGISTNIGLIPAVDALGLGFPSLKPKGFIGGGQIGYDWQINNWVLGLVADFQGADINASGTNSGAFHTLTNPPVNFTVAESLSNKLDFLGTGRVRVGWAMNNWLFYGSGGFAYGNVRSTIDFSTHIIGDGTAAISGSRTETRGGWAGGGGVNYAITPNWIVGADYLHYDLGHTSVTATDGVDFVTASQKVSGDIVRGVINYKF